MVDVSSIKELARRWYPRSYFASPEKHGGHRALADIRESIKELQYYREAVFVPLPGPDTATARAIAARYGGSSPESGAGQARPGNGAAGGAGRANGTGPASDAGQ
jgi:oligoribonuclease